MRTIGTVPSGGNRHFRSTVAALLICFPCASFGGELDRLQDLLSATPEGGWVKANLNTYSNAWPTGSTAVNINSYKSPASIVAAWSSFAWDSLRGDLLLFGGGHANYAGNEVYVWDGQSGLWSRGSLPSRVDSNWHVVDGAAPQSSHTYDNNVYLRNNDMFLTFGGAAFQSGGTFTDRNGRTGPWLWDPRKADANKVGGASGSGYDPSTPGGNMWLDRHDQLVGTQPPNYINGTTGYVSQNGRDVVYLTADRSASGFPRLYKYTFGDVRSGESDSLELVGQMLNTVGWQGTGTFGADSNLYIRTVSGREQDDLAIWELSKAVPGTILRDVPVELHFSDGSDFTINPFFAVEYDSVNDRIVLWDGKEQGTVYSTKVFRDSSGNILSSWLVEKLLSTTPAQPTGDFHTGVLGKWKFVPELAAFVALDEFRSGDAGVWLYKPLATAPIPEPGTWIMMLAGLVVLIGSSGYRATWERWLALR